MGGVLTVIILLGVRFRFGFGCVVTHFGNSPKIPENALADPSTTTIVGETLSSADVAGRGYIVCSELILAYGPWYPGKTDNGIPTSNGFWQYGFVFYIFLSPGGVEQVRSWRNSRSEKSKFKRSAATYVVIYWSGVSLIGS